MAKILTKDFSLSYKKDGSFVKLTNCYEIPELGNTAKEKIDVTVLEDEAKKSIDGLGDTAQDLAFKFYLDAESNNDAQFDTLCALTGNIEWKVEHPAGGIDATFSGAPSIKLDGVGVNGAVSYTLTISATSLIVFN